MASNLRKMLPSSTTLYVFDINQENIQRLTTEFGSYGRIEVASSAKDLRFASILPRAHIRDSQFEYGGAWTVPFDMLQCGQAWP